MMPSMCVPAAIFLGVACWFTHDDRISCFGDAAATATIHLQIQASLSSAKWSSRRPQLCSGSVFAHSADSPLLKPV